MIRSEGVTVLYRGNVKSIISFAPLKACQLALNDTIKNNINSNYIKNSLLGNITFSALAGLFTIFLVFYFILLYIF